MGSNRKQGRGVVAKIAVAVVVSCALVTGVGYGIGFAGGASGDAGTFGVGSQTIASGETAASSAQSHESDAEVMQEDMVLETTASRDISEGVEAIEARQEAERQAAEEAARQEEQEHIAAAEQAAAEQAAAEGLPALSEVNWAVGKDAFIAEWTARIDAYLEGSPLAGYGSVFASAAWEYGVDPRWSPAISNTESTKGASCFRAYNAWGWMGSASWSSWEESIYAHVRGLATGYGYTISEANAQKYCPPTWQDWYQKTLYQMTLI